MSFSRIAHTTNYLTGSIIFGNESILKSKVFAFSRSKICTYDIKYGYSEYDLDIELNENNELFCTTIVPLTEMKVYFDNPEYPNNNPIFYPLIVGDILSYVGIEPCKIEILNNLYNKENYKVFKFNVIKKLKKGTGQNKYKVAITFSDEYEIEIYADSEEEAKQEALKRDFDQWDHTYENINKSKINEYKSQEIRFTMWHPSQLYIKE